MPVKKLAKQHTSKKTLNRKNSASRWVIGVVVAIVTATGAFLVYSSFAAGPGIRTIYCRQGTCWNVQMAGSVAKSAYTRTNYACGGSLYLEYKIVGAKTSWNCLITGA